MVAPAQASASISTLGPESMSRWSFDQRISRYRDGRTGRFIPKADVVALRDNIVDKARDESASLAERLRIGAISRGEFTDGMRGLVTNAHGAQYLFGRGGLNAVTSKDVSTLQQAIVGQYGYIDNFANDLLSGDVSEARARQRAHMYADGSIQSYERARAASFNVDLPAYPGDGGTPCLTGCCCSWDISRKDGVVSATWKVGGADPCSGCLDRAAKWDPWVEGQLDDVEIVPDVQEPVFDPTPGQLEEQAQRE